MAHWINFFGVSLTPASITWTDDTADATNASVYSTPFNSQAIGTAATGRHIVVFVGAGGAAATISSVTLGGNTMTPLVTALTNSTSTENGLFIIQQDTGTTANIVVTFSATVSRCGIGVWALYDLQSATPVDTDSFAGTTTNPTLTMSTSADGVLVAGRYSFGSAAARTHTWTNATERWDSGAIETSASTTGADATTNGSSIAVTSTASGALTESVFLCATFR